MYHFQLTRNREVELIRRKYLAHFWWWWLFGDLLNALLCIFSFKPQDAYAPHSADEERGVHSQRIVESPFLVVMALRKPIEVINMHIHYRIWGCIQPFPAHSDVHQFPIHVAMFLQCPIESRSMKTLWDPQGCERTISLLWRRSTIGFPLSSFVTMLLFFLRRLSTNISPCCCLSSRRLTLPSCFNWDARCTAGSVSLFIDERWRLMRIRHTYPWTLNLMIWFWYGACEDMMFKTWSRLARLEFVQSEPRNRQITQSDILPFIVLCLFFNWHMVNVMILHSPLFSHFLV